MLKETHAYRQVEDMTGISKSTQIRARCKKGLHNLYICRIKFDTIMIKVKLLSKRARLLMFSAVLLAKGGLWLFKNKIHPLILAALFISSITWFSKAYQSYSDQEISQGIIFTLLFIFLF